MNFGEEDLIRALNFMHYFLYRLCHYGCEHTFVLEWNEGHVRRCGSARCKQVLNIFTARSLLFTEDRNMHTQARHE